MVEFCRFPAVFAIGMGNPVLFDASEETIVEMASANAQTLACSLEEPTPAGGNSSSILQSFDLETLKLFYQIKSGDHSIKYWTLNENSHRLLDDRRAQCRACSPTVLVRQDADEENSKSLPISTVPQEVCLEVVEDANLIVPLICLGNNEVVLCGKEDGSAHLYETTKLGRQKQKLPSHAGGISI